MFLANLSAVVRNYLDVGVQRFILAGAVRDDGEADAMRSAAGFRLRLVELRAPWPVIERRLRASPTTGRLEDLEDARADRGGGEGATVDAVVDSDRALAEVATEVLEQLGWSGPAA